CLAASRVRRWSSGWVMSRKDRPRSCCNEQPSMLQAFSLASTKQPSSSVIAMPTAACENIARSCSAEAPVSGVASWMVASFDMRGTGVLGAFGKRRGRRPRGALEPDDSNRRGPAGLVELSTLPAHHSSGPTAAVPMPKQKLLISLLAAAIPAFAALAAPLAEQVRDGDRLAALEAIRAGAGVDARLGDGSTALLWAVHRVDHELVKALLARGADPDVRNVLGATPLAEAVAIA